MPSSSDSDRIYPQTPLLGVSTAVWREDQLLIVQRGNNPMRGLWSLPGGRLHVGERLIDAAARELREETQVAAQDFAFREFVEIIRPDANGKIAGHFVLGFFTAVWANGEPVAGDDAMAARWIDPTASTSLEFTPGTMERALRFRPV